MLSEETPIAELMARLEEVTECGYYITYNPHKIDYESIEVHMRKQELAEDELRYIPGCIETGTLWELDCYQHTPVGHWVLYGPTLKGVIVRLLNAVSGDDD